MKNCPTINLDKKQRVVIIGAGPTGLGVAYRLYELGVLRSKTQVVILEQTNQVGGLASSYRDEIGFLWDNGGHVVFSHYRYYDDVLDKAVAEWEPRRRAAYAFMMGSSGKRSFIPYPVQNSIHLMDRADQDVAFSGLEEVSKNAHEKSIPKDFNEWLLQYFGLGLCKLFMTKYNHKVWTVHPKEMNALWMGERVAVPNVEVIRAKICASRAGAKEKSQDTKWGPNQMFRYPRFGGTGAIWKGVANLIPQGWFHYNQRVVAIDAQKQILQIKSSNHKKKLHYDYLISTSPIDKLVNMTTDEGLKTEELKSLAKEFVYSHTHVIGIGLSGQPPDSLINKSWIYLPDSDSPFYRVTVLSNYADDMVPKNGKYWSLMCEAAEPKLISDKGYWEKSSLIEKTINSLVNYCFINASNVVSRYHRRLEHGYPVPFLKREIFLKEIQPWLESRHIYSRGRFGGWRYEVGNQDHSFMQGVELADMIMAGIPEETYPNPNLVNSMRGSNRSLNCNPPLLLGPKYEFVIAHYNENFDWLKAYADNCHIYNKNRRTESMDLDFYQWESLPNVGRESHTYLYHIISNYDRLADITVFLQGSISNHKSLVYNNISFYVHEARKKGISVSSQSKLTTWGRIAHFGHWKNDLDHGRLVKSKFTLGEFWSTIFGTPHPNEITCFYGANFGVRKSQILVHPKMFYERIIQFVNYNQNPEEGHYFERLWYSMFAERK